MSIFGREAQAGRSGVAETNIDLDNTGIRQEISSVITINNLEENTKYCFAVAGYD